MINTALLPPFAAELLEWLGQAFPAAPEAALQLAALTLQGASEGHVCIALAQVAGQSWQGERLPALADCLTALDASGFVGAPGDYAPFVRDGERLYLARLWADETELARMLHERAGPSPLAPEQVKVALTPLFAGSAPQDGQRLAAATALLNRIALISGGPGTGKTTTVAKVLAALLQLEPRCRIVLAAPTGRAAARMVEALNGAKQQLGLDLVAQAALPHRAQTLHRLLGYRPDSATPRHGPDNPLALDALVVDEASMIDLALFRRLLAALPAQARLILLGDRDQLASVEAGSAFAELVDLAGHSAPAWARLQAASGADDLLPTAPLQAGPALQDGIARLQHSHRFGADSGIGALARSVNAGDVPATLALLQAGRADVDWQPGRVIDWLPQLLEALVPQLADYRAAIARHDFPAALAAFNRLRLLCAVREGPVGVAAINRLIETRLMQQDVRRNPWYAGRAVIVRANDAALGLANGDVGLTLAGPDGLRVHFADGEGSRAWAPARLPSHDSAFALTVHQSQGSEFQAVWLLLPDEEVAVLSRSLVYTALTRARRSVKLWGSGTTLAVGLGRETRRASGLAERLRALAGVGQA